MAEYIDRKKIKKSYYFQTKGGVFPKSELFVKRDDIFDMQPADVVEREKIKRAREEIENLTELSSYTTKTQLIHFNRKVLDILDKLIAESEE